MQETVSGHPFQIHGGYQPVTLMLSQFHGCGQPGGRLGAKLNARLNSHKTNKVAGPSEHGEWLVEALEKNQGGKIQDGQLPFIALYGAPKSGHLGYPELFLMSPKCGLTSNRHPR